MNSLTYFLTELNDENYVWKNDRFGGLFSGIYSVIYIYRGRNIALCKCKEKMVSKI